METKRCTYCQKVQRASVHVCSRCGRPFAQKKPVDPVRVVTTPSAPVASLHRAGHYSGLHPEDQPYQSTQMIVQRSVRVDHEPTHMPAQEEPDSILFSPTDIVPAFKSQHEASLLHHRLQSLRPPQLIQSLQHPVYRLRKTIWSYRVTSFLMVVSCLFFLVASSIISFVLIGHHSTKAAALVQVIPATIMIDTPFVVTGSGFGSGELISLLTDHNQPLVSENGQPLSVQTDKQGAFSVRLHAPVIWLPGKHIIHVIDKKMGMDRLISIILQPTPAFVPSLQITPSGCCDLGVGAVGTVSSRTLTLTNTGSGEVSWQGSSDRAWLSLSSIHDLFTQSEVIQITGKRTDLTNGIYTGHITFSQQSQNVVLTVTMVVTVTPAPSLLALSPMALTYQTQSGQDPADQLILLENTGGQTISWSARTISDVAPTWLALTPASGSLYPGASVNVHVSILAQQLAAGTYQGSVDFSTAPHLSVSVDLTVAPISLPTPTAKLVPTPTATTIAMPTVTTIAGTATPPAHVVPAIGIAPTRLNFITTVGSNPATQTITITNAGNTPFNWSISPPSAISWLSLDVLSGSLPAKASVTINVSCHSGALLTGTYQTSFSVYDSTTGQLAVPQSVLVTCLVD